MNILPKKSWHVLSRDNIQRVRRDEAAAKAEQEEKQARAAIAEREAQLDLMRKRAREKEGITTSVSTSSDDSKADGHINFFSDIQQGVGVQLTNKDHDQEAKAELETFEKKIGLLNYLVDKKKSDDPWYVADKKEAASSKSASKKELMDPINEMKHYLGKKRKCLEGDHTPQQRKLAKAEVDTEKYVKSSKSAHKKHKHKKDKKRDKEDKEASLERLRKERLKREEEEMLKSKMLLKQHYGLPQESARSTELESNADRPKKYNSQFNPDLARY